MKSQAYRDQPPSPIIAAIGLLAYGIVGAAVVWGFLVLLAAMA